MITIFNRKRLFSSFSVKAQASLREALAAHKIPYIVNAVNIAGGFGRADIRAAAGGVGLNLDYAYEYVIYVRKKDYQRAEDLLRAQIGLNMESENFRTEKKLRLVNRSFFIETTNNKILIRDACKNRNQLKL